jgi:tetratricopeptide (TPR) repeat protein
VSVLSVAGDVRGTLAYMSPEQARGDANSVDLRADVYALGLVTYEALSGRRPYDVQKPLVEAVRTICETPPTPLRRASEALHRIDPDLETILAKALEKEPERRYQSVDAFSEDIERCLTKQPILARPPSTLYQIRKLVARNRVPVAFLGALAVLLVTFGVGMSVLFARSQANLERALSAESAAEKEAQTANFVSDFMVGLFNVSNPFDTSRPDRPQGGNVTARQILDEGVQKIRSRADADPVVRARLMNTMGSVYARLGHYADAEPLIEEALETRRRLEPDGSLGVVDGVLELASLRRQQGRLEEARDAFVEALAMSQALLPEEDPRIARCLNRLGSIQAETGEYEAALANLRRALEIDEAVLGPEDLQVSADLNDLATLYVDLGELDKATELHTRSLAIKEKALSPDHPEIATALNNIAVIDMRTGRYAEAMTLCRRVLEIRLKALDERHPLVAEAYGNLGLAYAEQGLHDDALPLLTRSYELQKAIHGTDHPVLAQTLMNIGLMRSRMGDIAGARADLEASYAARVKIYGLEHLAVTLTAYHLAEVLLRLGEHERSKTLYEQVVATDEKILGPDHPDLADDLTEYAVLLRAMGKAVEAEAAEARAAAIIAKLRAAEAAGS